MTATLRKDGYKNRWRKRCSGLQDTPVAETNEINAPTVGWCTALGRRYGEVQRYQSVEGTCMDAIHEVFR